MRGFFQFQLLALSAAHFLRNPCYGCLDIRLVGPIMSWVKLRRGGLATMWNKGIQRIVTIALVLVFIFSAAGFAYETKENQMVVPDLLVGKPLGFIALGLGAATYALTLPITLPFGWQGTAADSLVKKPYRFTFERGLGEDLTGY